MIRPLNEIAHDIHSNWTALRNNPNHYAAPYLQAMYALESINDSFYADSGRSVVLYFLANANSWRGDTARRIKAELKAMLKPQQLELDI
jgi:hypothetical protein